MEKKDLLNGLLWAWSAGIILAGALYIVIPVLMLIAGDAETESFCSTNLALTGWACIALGFWGIDKAQSYYK